MEETTTNERGGKQSDIKARYDLIPAWSMSKAARVLHEGAEKYGIDNWKLISTSDHINHAIGHLYAYLNDGGTEITEDDLAHALVRIMFAIHQERYNDDLSW